MKSITNIYLSRKRWLIDEHNWEEKDKKNRQK